MEKGYSLTISGILASIALPLLVSVGLSEGCASELWAVLAPIPGAIIAYIGRYRQGDITPLGAKK